MLFARTCMCARGYTGGRKVYLEVFKRNQKVSRPRFREIYDLTFDVA